MNLLRVYAHTVFPQRTAEDPQTPDGGSLTINADVQTALDEAFAKAKLDQQDTIDFRIDTQSRTCEVRDLVMELAFGDARRSKGIATKLASRLSLAMDDRSPSSLLVLAASGDGATMRRITVWAFPRDESFQFRNNKSGVVVKLLRDTFSRNSRLRKAAVFEGRRTRTDFLSGRVLDHQASTGHKAADYWINDFLDCTLGLKGEAGTKILAQCLQTAFSKADSSAIRENLYAAMLTAHNANWRRTSLRKFARDHLSPQAKTLFLDASPNEEAKGATFDFKKDVFAKKLNFRIFHLENNIYVSAPFDAIGTDVTLSDGRQKVLKCEGVVLEEKVRARHG
ncbi:MAG: hypothetical protein JNL18_18025 [Planctomycetaceae bacterium]|nr:hypothetical protein [Planctomycetaceae bacterium]